MCRDTERFNSKWELEERTGCHVWKASKYKDGYGRFWHKDRMVRSHRFALELHSGEAPEGKPYALHSCGNRACCNPEHLRWGTQEENMHDRNKDGTHNKGVRHGSAKLSETDVRLIRFLSSHGSERSQVAEWFNVSRPSVSRIVLGVSWTHL